MKKQIMILLLFLALTAGFTLKTTPALAWCDEMTVPNSRIWSSSQQCYVELKQTCCANSGGNYCYPPHWEVAEDQ